ncbi:ubiquitin-conjugating enzyme E2 U isoform X1 [Pelodiscus sinensis]|uniref:ubiquitin-conjugating enzyme E2 U isoform X1 n=1 Tax=Pelodiscus sinensis TaxID=13735 RepID=UPI003F6CE1BC
MHSRAYLLLEREYLEYKEANIFGIFATPIKDNLLEWLVEVQGLKDSLWEGEAARDPQLTTGSRVSSELSDSIKHFPLRRLSAAYGAVLQLSIKYTQEYNSVPPTITFNTIPFHPNVDQHSGRPCIDFLDNPKEWNGKLTMSSIILAIQVMLSNPELENAVNVEAAEMLKNNISLYRQMVLRCVRTSQHLEDLPSTGGDCASSLKYFLPSEASSRDHVRRTTTISFEDYYRTWSGIATSKVAEHFKVPLFEDPAFIGNYYDRKAKNVTGTGEWDEDTYKAIVSRLIRKQNQQTIDEKLLAIRKIEQENSLFSQAPDMPGLVPKNQAADKERPHSKEEELWEREVDNLVAWTNTLSTKGLED